MSTAKQRSATTRAAIAEVKRLALIEDVEWLLSCQVGEAAILASTGYTDKPAALPRALYRAGRPDLVPRVFEWRPGAEERHYRQKKAA